MPRYELLGHGLRVHIKVLGSALIDESIMTNRQSGGIDGGLSERIVKLIDLNDSITVMEISEKLETKELLNVK